MTSIMITRILLIVSICLLVFWLIYSQRRGAVSQRVSKAIVYIVCVEVVWIVFLFASSMI